MGSVVLLWGTRRGGARWPCFTPLIRSAEPGRGLRVPRGGAALLGPPPGAPPAPARADRARVGARLCQRLLKTSAPRSFVFCRRRETRPVASLWMVVMCSHLALFSPDQRHADGFAVVTFRCVEVRRQGTDSLLFSDLAFST